MVAENRPEEREEGGGGGGGLKDSKKKEYLASQPGLLFFLSQALLPRPLTLLHFSWLSFPFSLNCSSSREKHGAKRGEKVVPWERGKERRE